MSLAGIWRVLLRRWYITLLGLLLTAGLVAGAVIKVPPTYSARATVLLIPPQTGKEVNPYLSLGGLQEVSDTLSLAISDDSTSQAVLAQGGSPSWSVGRDTSTSGPILLITSTGSSAEAALLTVKILVDKLNPLLQQLQIAQNVPQDSFIRTITVRQDRTAVIDRKGQLRSTILAGAVGMLLTVLLAAIADNRLNKRRDRKANAQADAQPETGGRRRSETSPRRSHSAESKKDNERKKDNRPNKDDTEPVRETTPSSQDDQPLSAQDTAPAGEPVETSEPAPTEPQFAAHFTPPAASPWQPPTSAWQPPASPLQHPVMPLGLGQPQGGGLQLPYR